MPGGSVGPTEPSLSPWAAPMWALTPGQSQASGCSLFPPLLPSRSSLAGGYLPDFPSSRIQALSSAEAHSHHTGFPPISSTKCTLLILELQKYLHRGRKKPLWSIVLWYSPSTFTVAFNPYNQAHLTMKPRLRVIKECAQDRREAGSEAAIGIILWLSSNPLCAYMCVCICLYIYTRTYHMFIHSSFVGRVGCFMSWLL